MTRDADMQELAETLLLAGWDGATEIEHTPDGHVHVRWNGRHVEAVSLGAAVEYIRRAVVVPDDGGDDD